MIFSKLNTKGIQFGQGDEFNGLLSKLNNSERLHWPWDTSSEESRQGKEYDVLLSKLNNRERLHSPCNTSREEEPRIPLEQNRFVNAQQVKSPLKKIAKRVPMQFPRKVQKEMSEDAELFLASQNPEIREQIKINQELKEVIIFFENRSNILFNYF